MAAETRYLRLTHAQHDFQIFQPKERAPDADEILQATTRAEAPYLWPCMGT